MEGATNNINIIKINSYNIIPLEKYNTIIYNYVIYQSFLYSVNNNNKAFSLIELSIVLVIFGLLAIGITGGQSLIENAKIKNLANEIDGWRKALLIFKAKNDRWPGDLDNDGFNVGWCGGDACRENETYTINSFPEPYNNKVQTGQAGTIYRIIS